jgi:putative ABC transport system substrate-binding protein
VDRRVFMGTLAGGLLAAPLAAQAQQVGKMYRIGSFLAGLPSTPPGEGQWYDRMRLLGWVYGQHFVVERRTYGDQPERIPDLAAELLRSRVDMFVVSSDLHARLLQKVTRTIPIVVSEAEDLVESGLAASVARPGGNVTGTQTLMPEVVGKQLALLKEAIPGLSRAGVLKGGSEVSAAVRVAETSGKALGIRLRIEPVLRVEDLDPAFSALRAGRAQGVLVLRSRFVGLHRKTVADLALKHRIPTICELSDFAPLGGLLSYGYDLRELYRLLAETVDTILRGTPVSEVPIRQVTTFQLVINLKTAKALGLTIPPSVLHRADQVIE